MKVQQGNEWVVPKALKDGKRTHRNSECRLEEDNLAADSIGCGRWLMLFWYWNASSYKPTLLAFSSRIVQSSKSCFSNNWFTAPTKRSTKPTNNYYYYYYIMHFLALVYLFLCVFQVQIHGLVSHTWNSVTIHGELHILNVPFYYCHNSYCSTLWRLPFCHRNKGAAGQFIFLFFKFFKF